MLRLRQGLFSFFGTLNVTYFVLPGQESMTDKVSGLASFYQFGQATVVRPLTLPVIDSRPDKLLFLKLTKKKIDKTCKLLRILT